MAKRKVRKSSASRTRTRSTHRSKSSTTIIIYGLGAFIIALVAGLFVLNEAVDKASQGVLAKKEKPAVNKRLKKTGDRLVDEILIILEKEGYIDIELANEGSEEREIITELAPVTELSSNTQGESAQ